MIQKSWILVLSLCVVALNAFPQVTDSSSLVVSSTAKPAEGVSKETKDDRIVIPKIYDMQIESNVTNRFAKTRIMSKVKNLDKSAHEAVFAVVIPEQAFISGFIMEIDGKSYEAYIQEKEEAKNTYKAAVASGQAAGHVAVSARDSNRFTVSVNIEPQSKVIFYLKYEELLKREDEKYQLVMNIHPGQPVPNLEAKVNIVESRPLKFVKAPSLRSGNEIAKANDKLNPNAKIDNINKTAAVVTFNPDIEKQKQYASSLGTKEDDGFAGQFVVEYDVERDPQGGEFLVDNGYFVHFFAPEDLPALPKQVVFVLDTSGSMEGIRIQQLKEAMKSILSELKKDDAFNIVEFNSIGKIWNVEAVAVQYESAPTYWYGQDADKENPFKNRTHQPFPPAYPATEENIKKAEQVVDKLEALGGTDIQTALKLGIQLVEMNLKSDKKHQPIIVFLTDGEPTVGETNTETIIKTISELNGGKTPIFSLSFGDGADRKFLEKLSLKNLGFARHIYEAADASLQLQEFYKQISSPLLSNVTFNYVSNVTEVTKRHFPILFRGSELVVAGVIDKGFYPPSVEGWGINGPVILIPKVENAVSSIERLWAYLTLKQILEQRDQADNKTGPTQEALRIALKYSFVSDVSSLVVVKPNDTNTVETEDGSKSDKFFPIVAGGTPFAAQRPAAYIPNRIYAQSAISAYHPPGFANYGSSAPLGLSGYSGPAGFYPQVHRSAYIHRSYITTPDRPHYNMAAIFDNADDYDEAENAKKIDSLKSKLPWLASALNANNTISLSSGTYELGLNATLPTNQDCSNSLSDSPGTCVLLDKCPQIFTQIQDRQSYEKHFCELQRYAGVCCPKPQPGVKN